MPKITGHEPHLWGSSLVGFGSYKVRIKKLGPHKTGKSCLYLRNLDAIDRDVLEEIIRDSVEYMREKYPGT